MHDSLPANNRNKIPSNLQPVCLKSQLYGRATEFCSSITAAQHTARNGGNLILNAIYQRDRLFVIREIYKLFNNLHATRKGQDEPKEGVELVFMAGVAKLNTIADSAKLPECITTLMLLPNSEIGDYQSLSSGGVCQFI